MTDVATETGRPDSSRGAKVSRRAALITTLVGAIVVLGASIAVACIPWTGKLELENLNKDDDENGAEVYGADHSDEGETDSSEGLTDDAGNGQGMIWCDADDTSFGQQYRWAEVRPDGDTASDDVTFFVDDNNGNDSNADNGDSNNVTTDEADGCPSDLYLPEDKYTITFEEDSFDNEDDSSDGNSNPTYADNIGASDNPSSSNNDSDGSNADSDEVGTVDGSLAHCMDTGDTDEDPGTDPEWDLREDDDGDGTKSAGDSTTTVDEYRFTSSNDTANGQNRDVVDEDANGDSTKGLHDKSFDIDQFAPDSEQSGGGVFGDSDDDGHTDAAGLCITSFDTFEHDNNDHDDDDSEVDNGDRDDKQIEYGNAIPVNILPTG